MSKNTITIELPCVKNNGIFFTYHITGPWKEAFAEQEAFQITYDMDISKVPAGVAMVPLLANLLPMAWVCDAEITVPVCDRDFWESIPDFKKGYEDMYPGMPFGGRLTVREIATYAPKNQAGAIAFFSGGVDAFQTLIAHAGEHPTLLTIWGSDVTLEDESGWQRVEAHLKQTALAFQTDCVTIRSNFRYFLQERVLSEYVAACKDNWWHGFQHGIGIVGHAAPALYALGKKTVYFASSFTPADKGKATCASDPTIEGRMRFCGAQVIHDGYSYTRQEKIHHITHFYEQTGQKISLRVCWESAGGSNCCNCEKCWRTILGIYAEGYSPHTFGFSFDKKQLRKLSRKMHYHEILPYLIPTYRFIQETMRSNRKRMSLPAPIRWFYTADILKIGKIPLWRKAARKVKQVLRPAKARRNRVKYE